MSLKNKVISFLSNERMVLWLRHWTRTQDIWVQFPALPQTPGVTLGKSRGLSMLQSTIFKMGIINFPFCQSCPLRL